MVNTEQPIGARPIEPQKRRRSSATPNFESLQALKRSNDPMSQARRMSLHEQKPTAGFFGQMWHNFTRGPLVPPKQ